MQHNAKHDLSYSGHDASTEFATDDFCESSTQASKRLVLGDRQRTLGVLFSAGLLALFATTLALTVVLATSGVLG